MQLMTLREICVAVNVSRRAIQGYEKAGLVSAVSKNERGHLLYDEKGKESIQRIKTLQEIGFSIKEIQNLKDANPKQKKTALLEKIEILKKEGRRVEKMIQIAEEMILKL